MKTMSLSDLAALSRKFGARAECVLAGGGNTSFKDEKNIWVKPSGIPLADVQAEDFVLLDRAAVRATIDAAEKALDERESAAKRFIDFAVISSKNGRRPSVEAPLHELFADCAAVVHLHPTLVNALTCGAKGKEICAEIFPEAIWLDETDPGATLAINARAVMREGARVLFIQNHGVFVGGNSCEEIENSYAEIFEKLNARVTSSERAETPLDAEFVFENAPILRGLLAENGVPATVIAAAPFEIPTNPLTPDHIVYSKSFPLITEEISREAVEKFRLEHGYLPRAILVPGRALFAAGPTPSAAETALLFIKDAAEISRLARDFGGLRTLSPRARRFIETWEMESYRAKVAAGSAASMKGKIVLITGAAQGFGFGIAESLVKQGAHIIVADLNAEGANAAAKQLGNASAMVVNVGDEESVESLAKEVVTKFGGLDLLVSNAGVLRASSVKTMSKKDWDFVTAVNYTGFFLLVKHFAPIMARQNAASGLWTDIVQVNSKSGLTGSNKNAAYAGGKFGGIGQVQSYALELVSDKIKVNAVCPGNFYDGPLWSDPVRGLFKQYLDTGKVPGAKTIEDVKKFYLEKSPIKRGCFPSDVALAITYCCNQQFETGQAIPITGGQVMLN